MLAGDMSVCEAEASPEPRTDTTPPNYVFARDKSVTRDDFNKFKEEMRHMIQSLLQAQGQDIKSSIEHSIAVLTSQQAELNKKISQLEINVKEGSERLTLLEERVENMQVAWRKTNFEIKNIPRKPNETKDDLVEMVLHLSNTIGADLNKSDIKDVYRVRGKRDQQQQNTPVVVETSSTLKKTNVLKLCRAFNIKTKSKLCAKHLGFRISEDTPVFVSEQLTARGSRLHFLGRDLVKSRKYKYCWTAYGKVYVRMSDSSPIITINSEAQALQLMQND